MDYLYILADHVDDNGNVTNSLYPDDCPELLSYNGKNISAALTGAYNYSEIKPLPLVKGKAPKCDWDCTWGEYSRCSYDAENGYNFHWCMLDDLFKMDFQRKIIDVRNSKLWNSSSDKIAAYIDLLVRNEFVTIEEFIGEDFLAKMRKLQEKGFNRITVMLK